MAAGTERQGVKAAADETGSRAQAGQAADPNLHTLFAITLCLQSHHKNLQLGSPVRGRSRARKSALRHVPTHQLWENGSMLASMDVLGRDGKPEHTPGSMEVGLSSTREQQNSPVHKQ
eukprot:1157772-Pelagomonas_calceolata.AAC.4